MLLENKVCIIYGAGGAIGSAIARGFAREGTRLFLAGRNQAKLDTVANDIRANGARADTQVLDALDAKLPLTLLKRSASLADVGNVAAFLASDLAQSITATEVNISFGAIVD